MPKIYVAAGHSANTEGERLYEFEKCRVAQEYLAQLLRWAGNTVIEPPQDIYDQVNDSALRAKIGQCNAAECDLAVELHLNAGGGKYATNIFFDNLERGTTSEKGEELAERISSAMEEILPWPCYWNPQSHYGRSLAFLNQTKCTAVITEPAFKDTPEHRQWIDTPRSMVDYATSVYMGIVAYLYQQ